MAQSNLGGLKIGAVPDMVYWIGRDEMLPRLLFDNQVKASCRRLRSKYRSSLLPSPVPFCAGVPDSISTGRRNLFGRAPLGTDHATAYFASTTGGTSFFSAS